MYNYNDYNDYGVYGPNADSARMLGLPPDIALRNQIEATAKSQRDYMQMHAVQPSPFTPGITAGPFYPGPTRTYESSGSSGTSGSSRSGARALLWVTLLFSLSLGVVWLAGPGKDEISRHQQRTPEAHARFYEAVDATTPALAAPAPANRLFARALKHAPGEWTQMKPKQQAAVASAWRQYVVDPGSFRDYDDAVEIYYRGAFASYLRALGADTNPAIAGDLARLELSYFGGRPDKAKATKAFATRDYSSLESTRESIANAIYDMMLTVVT